MKFLLASSNQHKASELQELLDPSLMTIEASSEKLEVVEDGDSFHANALKKAKEYYEKFNTPTLSDDSGLVVQALPDKLGIYSARYGGEGLNDTQRCELLLTELGEERSAYFVCVLCFYLNPEEIFFFEGRLQGAIAPELSGNGGFGYDPVFIPLGQTQTVAEIPEWKMANSHRAKAAAEAVIFLRQFSLPK